VKRVLAIVLPDLLPELVYRRAALPSQPIGVIVESPATHPHASLGATVLDAVNDVASELGVRAGQRAAEAFAVVAELQIHRVTSADLEAALGQVAELALGFGTTAAIALGAETPSNRDTVWLDITGAAHLVGGEEALRVELIARVEALGHRARVAIADGPRIARAIARWGSDPAQMRVSPGRGAEAMASLPVCALSLDAATASYLARVGVVLVRDLARLPSASVAARLGAGAIAALDLIQGRDATPLTAYVPPRVVAEEVHLDEGTSLVEPLLFVLRGMLARLSARLQARGEACTRIELTIAHDPSIARLRRANDRERRDDATVTSLVIEVPSPLAREADLFRPLKTKLEATELFAPAVGLRVALPSIVRAPRVQHDLSRSIALSPDALPSLLAELSAELGPERVGVLDVCDAHRPEARSALHPLSHGSRSRPTLARSATGDPPLEPTRLLQEPVRLGRARPGAIVVIDQRRYTFERAEFLMRLESVEWWLARPISRDYAIAWLVAAEAARSVSRVEAGASLVFLDRSTRTLFLQGWFE
jgi:protein ImuB